MSTRIETISGKGATFDAPPEHAIYRYRLWRKLLTPGTQRILFVMLNPSTADALQDDPTIRRCAGFAEAAGAGSFDVVNLFALRATDPIQLDDFIGDIVGPENDEEIAWAARDADLAVCAWGARADGRWPRVERVLGILRSAGHRTLYCLGETQAGHPKHPLYLAGSTPLEVYAK